MGEDKLDIQKARKGIDILQVPLVYVPTRIIYDQLHSYQVEDLAEGEHLGWSVARQLRV